MLCNLEISYAFFMGLQRLGWSSCSFLLKLFVKAVNIMQGNFTVQASLFFPATAATGGGRGLTRPSFSFFYDNSKLCRCGQNWGRPVVMHSYVCNKKGSISALLPICLLLRQDGIVLYFIAQQRYMEGHAWKIEWDTVLCTKRQFVFTSAVIVLTK